MKTQRILTLLAATLLTAPAFAEGDVAAGEADFKKCKACHMIADGDNVIFKGGKTGPNLFGIVGKQAGTVEGYRYGADLVAAGEAGLVWDEANLAEYLKDPKKFLQETLGDGGAKSKMAFKLSKGSEDVAAYLATFAAAQ
ncbi:c-type cytochrome [Pseudoruegeria sp. SHC-113]|uniref:c-type cytochrome n=1 Tax=Pseudoruegeria sp. SHC-113 TaxID=2855439 RepID=UPI0021BAF291|nr:cytochrome C [Pseudoruegeria sp. SHC-113]MCT8160916.1 cytochrome C [Pseudoruegeria sp. SHC-113]